MVEKTAEHRLRRGLACATMSDEQLTDAVREGSTAAYEELWQRHSSAGVCFARSFSYVAEPEEIVGESFCRILATLRKGVGGPVGAFRPYLLTTIRNVAATWGRRSMARKEEAFETFELFEGDVSAEDAAISSIEQSTVMRALRALPSNWQAVLWYTEVEQLPRDEVARLLGMKPNAVSQLSFRAREALRTAWVQAHVDDDRVPDECREISDQLGAYTRHRISPRAKRKVEAHLAECKTCAFLVGDLDEVSSRFARIAVVAILGVTGAAAFQSWQLVSGAGAGGAQAATLGGAHAGAGTVLRTAAHASTAVRPVAVLIGAGVVATVAVAATALGALTTPGGSVAADRGHAVHALPTPQPSDRAPIATPSPRASAVPVALPAPIATPGASKPAPTHPSPHASGRAVAHNEPSGDDTPSPSPSPTSTPADDPAPVVYRSTAASVGSGLCIDAGTPVVGGRLTQQACAPGAAQQLEYDVAAQSLAIGGLCLTADDGPVLAACDGTDRQQWTLRDGGLIVNAATSQCLDVMQARTDAGAPIILWPCHGGTNQQWTTALPTPPDDPATAAQNLQTTP